MKVLLIIFSINEQILHIKKIYNHWAAKWNVYILIHINRFALII